LRDLQVRKARHDEAGVLLGLRGEGADEGDQQLVDLVDFLAQPEAQVGRDLVIARASGMEALAGFADEGGEAPLYVEVNVLGIERPLEAAVLDLAPHALEPALDRRKIPLRDDAGRGQHAGMGKRTGDVLPREPPIEVDRGAEALDALVDGLPEAPRPKLRLTGHARTMNWNAV
jgi:hypothetical protein